MCRLIWSLMNEWLFLHTSVRTLRNFSLSSSPYFFNQISQEMWDLITLYNTVSRQISRCFWETQQVYIPNSVGNLSFLDKIPGLKEGVMYSKPQSLFWKTQNILFSKDELMAFLQYYHTVNFRKEIIIFQPTFAITHGWFPCCTSLTNLKGFNKTAISGKIISFSLHFMFSFWNVFIARKWSERLTTQLLTK